MFSSSCHSTWKTRAEMGRVEGNRRVPRVRTSSTAHLQPRTYRSPSHGTKMPIFSVVLPLLRIAANSGNAEMRNTRVGQNGYAVHRDTRSLSLSTRVCAGRTQASHGTPVNRAADYILKVFPHCFRTMTPSFPSSRSLRKKKLPRAHRNLRGRCL